MASFKHDPMGTVRRSAETGTILIRSLNRHGHPGWIAIYDRPDPNPNSVYFHYELGGWDGADRFEKLTECIVGAPV